MSENNTKTALTRESLTRMLPGLTRMADQNHRVVEEVEILDYFQEYIITPEMLRFICNYLRESGYEVISNSGENSDDSGSADPEDFPADEDDAAGDAAEKAEEKRRKAETDDSYDTSVGASIGDSVRMYMKEIGRSDLLTAEEEVDFARRIEAGRLAGERLEGEEAGSLSEEEKQSLRASVEDGREARTRLTESNLRLVVSIAKGYVGHGMPLSDLIQEGNIGLMTAVEKFDYTKGYRFSTYATWWIKQAISRALADKSRTIRIPVHVAGDVTKLNRTASKLAADLGHDPSIDELADAMDLSVDRVKELRKYSQSTISLDTPVGDEDDSQIGDFVADTTTAAPEQAAESEMLKEQLEKVLGTLTEREQQVIRLRFGLDDDHPHTLEEIGQQFGVTRERIRQIETKALRKLHHPTRSRQLRDYIEN